VSGGENQAGTATRIGFNLVALIGSRLAGMALTLVQMGIIFRALDVEGRGQFGFSWQFASLFTVLATLGIQRLLVRDIARDPAIAWRYVWTALAVVAVLSGGVFAGVAGAAWLLADAPGKGLSLVLAAVWVVVLWAWQRPFESLLIARERMGLVALVNTAGAVLKLVAIFLVMQRCPTSAAAHGAIAVSTGAAFALCVAATIFVAGWERPRVRLGLALSQLRECYPFAVAMAFSLVYFKADMSLLALLQGDTAAGIYTPPQRVMEPLLMIAGLWGTAIFPALCRLSHAAPGDYAQLKRTSLRWVILVSAPMAVGLALLAGPVIGLLTGGAGDAQPSVPVLAVLAAMTPFFYLNSVAQEFLYAVHRNWFVVASYGVGAALSVGANLVVIPAHGPLGAAMVAVVVNAVISGFFLYAVRTEIGAMGLPTLLLKTSIACALMAALVWAVLPLHWALAIAAGATAYCAVILILRTPDAAERAMLSGLIAPFRRRR
jgi:O-antigen/teichoic acid export membrane protein